MEASMATDNQECALLAREASTGKLFRISVMSLQVLW